MGMSHKPAVDQVIVHGVQGIPAEPEIAIEQQPGLSLRPVRQLVRRVVRLVELDEPGKPFGGGGRVSFWRFWHLASPVVVRALGARVAVFHMVFALSVWPSGARLAVWPPRVLLIDCGDRYHAAMALLATQQASMPLRRGGMSREFFQVGASAPLGGDDALYLYG
jgi:hypothetical protein